MNPKGKSQNQGNSAKEILAASLAHGYHVNVSNLLKPKPKLKLSTSVPVSVEFRAEMNDWLLKRFGEVCECHLIGDELIVSPETYEQLLKECKLNERLDQQGK